MLKRVVSILALSFLAMFSCLADRPSFALVLSGGGARGVAHIAVFEELEKRGIYPDYIVGTSMGALIGAFYSAGYDSKQIIDLITDGSMMNLFINVYTSSGNTEIRGGEGDYLSNVFSIDFSPSGVGASNGIIDDEFVAGFLRTNLSRVLSIDDFDQLSIPFRCVGTDLVTGQEIVFSHGSFYEAIRASMAMPVIFTPVVLDDGRYVVDGGVVNNLPVDVARDLGVDVVLAVDVNNSRGVPGSFDMEGLETLTGVANQYLNLTTNVNSARQYDYADHVLVMDTYDFNTMDFTDLGAVIDIGREYVRDNMELFDSLEEELGERSFEKPLNYFDRPEYVMIDLVYPGLEQYGRYFDYFEGKAATKELMQEFERTLRYIKSHEKLKSISYRMFSSGMVYIEVENYKDMASSISLGLDMSMGIRYHSKEAQDFSFCFMPRFDLFADVNFPSLDGIFRIGIDVGDMASLFSGYYYPFGNSYEIYAEAEIGVGSLSMLSKRDRFDRMDTRDFGFNLRGGLSYSWKNTFRMDFLFAFDFASLGSLRAMDGTKIMGTTPVLSPKAVFTINHEGLTSSIPFDTGFDFFSSMVVYLRAPFMYSLSMTGGSVIYSPVENTRFFLNFEASSLRAPGQLSTSYRATHHGQLTRDYVMAEIGGRVLFSDKAFIDVGFYSELFDSRPSHTVTNEMLWNNRDIHGVYLAPFSLINDFTAGFCIGFGYSTGIGTLGFRLYTGYEGTSSLGFFFK